jgi:arylformamidase
MIITLENGRRFDAARPLDISIPLRFNGPQPNAYGVEPASGEACEYGSLVGDTRRGGSVNFERYTFIPHCNGTHTECVGHITDERISVRECLQDVLIPSLLVSVRPENVDGDQIITRVSLESELDRLNFTGPQPRALIVRTLPNGDWKLTAEYGEGHIPAYFTSDAMGLIVELGVKHLLADLPSIDRIFDDGKLSNHRRFWNIQPGSHETDRETRLNSTVTELIYVPDGVEDGEYLLDLQIAPFAADCSPSRPLLFRYN